jgi:hypothetical protein
MNKFPVRLGVIAFLIALTAAAGLLVCGHILINGPDPFAARRFDPEAWSTADSKGRAAMTRDAIRHLPAGLPESEITKLLGEAGDVIATEKLVGSTPGGPLPLFAGSAPAGSVRTYSYDLGSWGPSRGYDSTFLWVHVNSNGRVVAAVIGGG